MEMQEFFSFFSKQRHDVCSKAEETRVFTCFRGVSCEKGKIKMVRAESIASGLELGERMTSPRGEASILSCPEGRE